MSPSTLRQEATVSEPAADPAPPADGPAPRRRRLLAALVALALLAAVALGGYAWREHDRASDLAAARTERSAALSTARSAASLLLALDASTGKATLARLGEMATGAFAEQVDTLADTVAGVLTQGKVSSRGSVTSAGVETLGRGKATVLVAATAAVANSELPQGELRTFRMAISLVGSDRDWKVSDVEFLG